MINKKAIIKNETGFHARPAAEFVKFCMKYDDEILIKNGIEEINAKSIVSILSAGLKKGMEIEVKVVGKNEEQVCEEVTKFIENIKD